MKRNSLWFIGPNQIELREEEVPQLGPGEVLVEAKISAISAGTEMLIYRGQAPQDLGADESLTTLQGSLSFPLKYGYSAVGQVVELGPEVASEWQDKIVFAFNPHETYFVSNINDLHGVDSGIKIDDAVFLPNMETAVNFIMDGHPRMGERAVVLGQGIVGLLTASLLAHHPLDELISFDRIGFRRMQSLKAGVTQSFDPDNESAIKQLIAKWAEGPYGGADLIYELTGSPAAIDLAIRLAGFQGRVVVGSWYGQKQANIDLGGKFHRQRIEIVSSQVSTLTPHLSGRWNKARRFLSAWEAIKSIRPSQFITHHFDFADAAQAYELVNRSPGEVLQVVFDY